MRRIITTSWDDGFVLDDKIAELLSKYNLQGTFYIPKHNDERPVMDTRQLLSISAEFEIGGHTLNHVRLKTEDDEILEKEIKGSFNWLKQLLGYKPTSFCFPGGKYSDKALKAVFKYGYRLARTTELLSLHASKEKNLVATTMQVYEHSYRVYVTHLLKRKKIKNLLQWLTTNTASNLCKITESYLKIIEQKGGCFHLWGHSWEIEEYSLWNKLENLFKILSNNSQFLYIQNQQLLQYD